MDRSYRDHRLLIRCVKCNKLCDRYEATPDRGEAWRIVVWCHGDRDEMRLTADFIQAMLSARGADGLPEGLAFLTERLTHG